VTFWQEYTKQDEWQGIKETRAEEERTGGILKQKQGEPKEE
jgi:hypothetical protein